MTILTITHTCPRFHGDSAAPFMEGLGNGFSAIGDRLLMLAPYDPLIKSNDPAFRYELIPYRYAPLQRWHVLGYSRMLNNDMGIRPATLFLGPLMIQAAIHKAQEIVRQRRVDILHAHWIVPNGYIGAAVARRTGVPLVVTLPGSDVYIARKHLLFRILARSAFRVAAAITTNSPALGEDLVGLGADPQKIHHIVYGVDTRVFRPSGKGVRELKKQWGLDSTKVTVVGVGRLVDKKGFHILLDALGQLKSLWPNIQVVLVGDGDARAVLEAQAVRLKLHKIVRFVGQQPYDALPRWYNLADIFVLPSIRDRAGNLDDQSVSLVEAMSCGKPVVTSDLSGYRLVVSDGKEGYLTPAGDARALAGALRGLVGSPSKRAACGSAARIKVTRRFSWSAIAKQYHQLFEHVRT